jgi:hypothetical protein
MMLSEELRGFNIQSYSCTAAVLATAGGGLGGFRLLEEARTKVQWTSAGPTIQVIREHTSRGVCQCLHHKLEVGKNMKKEL